MRPVKEIEAEINELVCTPSNLRKMERLLKELANAEKESSK